MKKISNDQDKQNKKPKNKDKFSLKKQKEKQVDKTLEDSFPASDPPPYE